MNETDRLMLRNAARQLIDAARRERGRLAADDDERDFYLGVDAAAMEVLRPEARATRRNGWLDREPAAFREGYVRTRALLVGAQRPGAVPARVRLPQLDERVAR